MFILALGLCLLYPRFMPKTTPMKGSKYANQRPKVPVPVVSTAVLRKAKGLTIQAVCDHMREEHGMSVDRGTISAIENGHRGASAKMLAAYADALGVHALDVDTLYEPRNRGDNAAA